MPRVMALAVLVGLLLAGCGTSASSKPRWAAAAAPSAGPASSEPAPTAIPTAAPTAVPSPLPTTRSPRPKPPDVTGPWKYAFPVVASPASYQGTHSGYPATDIFAACGSPVRAVTDGVVLEVSRVDRYDPSGPNGPLNGGLFVSIRGDDGVRYYGSHLTEVTAGIDKGVRVRGGQRVGSVGKTGNSSNVCHLHFGISPPCQQTGDWWVRRGVVWPASYLDAWRKGTAKSPVAAVAAWHQDRGCPAAP